MLDQPLSLRHLPEQLESLFRGDGRVHADVEQVGPIVELRPELADVIRLAYCDNGGIGRLEPVLGYRLYSFGIVPFQSAGNSLFHGSW